MTSGLFWISYAAVWVLLLALSGGLLVLFRFSVRGYRTQAPEGLGDVGTMNGPALDAVPPPLELQDLEGEPISIGAATGSPQLIVFAKNTCPKCKIALGVLRSFATDQAPFEPIVVCGGKPAAIEECASMVAAPMLAVADLQWRSAKAWQVSDMPFGVILDPAGVVRGRGDPTSAAMLTILTRQLERDRDARSMPPRGRGVAQTADNHLS